jgi:penicillin-insensitive murein DD-endopeptidase
VSRRFAFTKALAIVAAMTITPACVRVPTPLAPQVGGSIGLPHRGMLSGSLELPASGPGFKFLRDDDRHHGLPRFAAALARAAARVEAQRPGGVLVLGDLSKANGGQLLPHLSHRTGRDADLLLYAMTLEGAPVESPGFVHFGADGLAWDETHRRFLRFDVEREWLLVKALVEDPEARVQWLFSSRIVEALLLEWATARGEPAEIVWRASEVMLQPQPGGLHDDHLHARTACSEEDVAHGCETSGPLRPWLVSPPRAAPDASESDAALAVELFTPIETPAVLHADAKR